MNHRTIKRNSPNALFAVTILMCTLVTMGIIGWQHSTEMRYMNLLPNWDSISYRGWNRIKRDEGGTDSRNYLVFHPFENACKFVIPSIYPVDISHFRVAERLRQLQCPYEDLDFATMDSEGYMYVHPHFTVYPKYITDVKCKVVFLEGALRDNVTNKGKNDFKEVAEVEAPENKRFFANGDAFYIRCSKNNTRLFEQVYPGMRDLDKIPNKVYLAKDMKSFDDWGRRLEPEPKKSPDPHYSIDILGFDSTSRTMFMRHLPRTMETMDKLGYELFYGYNKVGDNSAVNLVPILAGDVPEALQEPKLDQFGDININWVLPTQRKLDPTNIPFLWKMMGKEFGCRSMLNEDISMQALGLFHYPGNEFLPGFTSPPADHFYRTYYLAVYKNWRYSQCRDGGQVQRRYVDLWRRFANKYKDICHMGFTFVTTLSHEAGFVLELLDEQISSSLENLYFTGALDNGISVIMGDHGNRIGMVQFSYSGRIEERMPLMAIRLPPKFKESHPKEYFNFMANKWKLTSNFDIHQTLKDIALMKFGSSRRSVTPNYGRGISLFDEIPDNRSCFDAYIPENFCTCMIDRSNLADETKRVAREEKILSAIRLFLGNKDLDDCFRLENITIVDNITVLGLNPLARHGFRKKDNASRMEEARKKNPKMDFLYHELSVVAEIAQNRGSARLLFRVEESKAEKAFRVVLEPLVQDAPTECYAKSVFNCPYNAMLKETESFRTTNNAVIIIRRCLSPICTLLKSQRNTISMLRF
ncbi:unnamed protein product [Cylicocyclus nassatus]|uniref:Uncharacterized protein n=1 Tax=Cylicocyclus nassatus TaxID=53992 RepID=A0AA36H7L3_CYLNA|nr:unnamed protein product [Cylicocyclus nassatus]